MNRTPADDQTASFHAPAPAKEAPIPSRLGRFEIISVLGEGAFGRVYKARDPKLDREVALKVPKPGAFASVEERERFLREARAAAAIQHPNICPVHDVVLDVDNVYIVMAYVRGQSLAEYLRDRKNALNAKQAALIVRKLALALHAAHAKGIVHRDLKPGNILFDAERKDVVITDFGLARRGNAGDAELTQAGAIMGTPAYMSPEQARGDSKNVGPPADIHALGVILYELLTGTRPFTGSMGEILGKVQHVAPEAPSKIKPGLDARLDKICLKALAKAPKDRFGSMREFAHHLGEYLKDVPMGAVAAGAPAAKAELAAPSEAAQMAEIMAVLSVERKAAAQSMERSHRSVSRTIFAVGGCLGVLMVLATCTAGGIGAWLFWRGGSDAPSGPIVSVRLQNITHLHDNSVHYWLDGKQIDSKKLEGPLKLAIGEHQLVAKRDGEEIEKRSFNVGPEDDQAELVPPLAEPDGPVGLVNQWKLPINISSVAVSPDGRWVAGVGSAFSIFNGRSGSVVGLWEIDSGKEVNIEKLNDAELALFAPNGKHVHIGFRDGNKSAIVKYDLRKPDVWKDVQRFECSRGYQVQSLSLSRDGSIMSMGTYHDGALALNIWNTQDAKRIAGMDGGGYISCLAPDGKRVFAAKGNDVIAYEIRDGKLEARDTFTGHTAAISCIACSPDGRFVAAGATNPTNAVRAWNVETGKPLDHFKRHSAGVMCVRFSPGGKRLMSASSDGILRLCDVQSGSILHETPPQGASITCAAFTPGGRRAVFGLSDGTIKVWQLPAP